MDQDNKSDVILSNSIRNKFVYEVMAYFSNHGYANNTESIMSVTTDSEDFVRWKLEDSKNSIYLTGIFIEIADDKFNMLDTSRWHQTPLFINHRKLYLSNQWSEPEYRKTDTTRRNDLSFPCFKRLIEHYYKPYSVVKENDIFVLKKDNDKENKVVPFMNDIITKQEILFGAPGTGKSHSVKNYVGVDENGEMRTDNNIRVTFHPDSDYASFIGCYKPTMIKSIIGVDKHYSIDDLAEILKSYVSTGEIVRGLASFCMKYAEYLDGVYGHVDNYKMMLQKAGMSDNYSSEIPKYLKAYQAIKPELVKRDGSISYDFVAQAFVNAYVEAWKQMSKESPEPFYLIIEEINRGNCAQIFGDMFQLLDRNDDGFSSYGVTPDSDLRDCLCKAFSDVDISDVRIKNGERMKLPPTLSIIATMNTSDQSLFPIDSAFKRRWDWKYVPIADEHKDWVIEVDGFRYDWWSFLSKINDEIGDVTSSEDKKLGYYFCKAKEGVICAEKFVSKVIFYLWNDVFKDYGFDKDYLKDENGGDLTFDKFYSIDGRGEINSVMVKYFLDKLGVKKFDFEVELNEDEFDGEEEELENNDNSSTKRLRIQFKDGTEICEKTQFDSYFEALKTIGIEKVEAIAARMKYSRRGCPLVSTIKHEPVLNDGYQYIEERGYYVIKGINVKTMISFLNQISDEEHLNLKVDTI